MIIMTEEDCSHIYSQVQKSPDQKVYPIPTSDEMRLAILNQRTDSHQQMNNAVIRSKSCDAIKPVAPSPSPPPPPPPHRTSSASSPKQPEYRCRNTAAVDVSPQLSPPTPFADEDFVAATLPHLVATTKSGVKSAGLSCDAGNFKRPRSSDWQSSKPNPQKMDRFIKGHHEEGQTHGSLKSNSRTEYSSRSRKASFDNPIFEKVDGYSMANNRMCKTLPRKVMSNKNTIPPPPQYKGVHFAPSVDAADKESSGKPTSPPPIPIPTEGLPTRPARVPAASSSSISGGGSSGKSSMILIPQSETVPITVRNNNPVPLLLVSPSASKKRSSFIACSETSK